MRVVSLAPSNTEIVDALGLADQLIAVTNLCDFPQGIEAGKSIVGGWTDSDIEKVVGLKPDLVLTSTFVQKKIAESLRSRGVNVLHLDVRSLHDVGRSFTTIAEALSQRAAGQKLESLFTTRIEKLTQRRGRIRIYIEEWMNPPSVSGNWVPELLERAGGSGISQPDIPSQPVTHDQVVLFDPAAIVVTWCNTGSNPNLEALFQRPGWSDIPAIARRRVVAVDDSLLNRPGPRLVEGLQFLVQTVKTYATT